MSLLTLIRSKVDHAKILRFLSRKANKSTCSSGFVSVRRQTALLDTLGSNATFLKSSLASMAFLNSTGTSVLMGHAGC
jgi:hypothetical protein